MSQQEAQQGSSTSSPKPELTPRKDKKRGDAFKVTSTRPATVQAMKDEMLECPLDNFLEHYLPFSPSSQWVGNALQYLKEKGELIESGEDDVWNAYQTPPSGIHGIEQSVFKGLDSIFGGLSEVECPTGSRKREFHYRECPGQYMTGEIRGSNFKVDGVIARGSTPCKDAPISAETAVTMEFKKNNTEEDFLDDREKLVSAVSHIMNDDPRRGWMYGITIEDNIMSLWYFSRSHSVKSKPLDFTKDIKTCIRVFLSLLYATPEELGYDQTIHRVQYKGKWRYIYELGTKEAPRYFRTTELIYNPRVLCITGRKSRVWKAVEVKGPSVRELGRVIGDGSEVVVKDVWLNEGSLTEKEIQEAIFDRLSRVRESDYTWATGQFKQDIDAALQNCRRYFMGIDHDRLLEKTKPVAKPAKHVPGLLEPSTSASAPTLKNVIPGSTQSQPSSDFEVRTEGQNTTNRIPREYKVKQHYRLVYSDVGHPLHRESTLAGSISAVCDSFIALVLLYLARWVHRDVSPGNIILVKERDGTLRGKLSDLEYAQDFDDQDRKVSRDPKTGTPYFMPLEIHRGWRLYYPPQNIVDLDYPDNLSSLLSVPDLQTDHRKNNKAPLRYIFPHDVESLFWIIVWILLCRVKYEPAHQLGAPLFTDSALPSREREQFILDPPQQRLQDSIHPTLQHIAPAVIKNICATLFQAYHKDTIPEEELARMYILVWRSLKYLHLDIRTSKQAELLELRAPSTLDDPFTQAEAPQKRQRKPKDDDEYTEGTGAKGMKPSKKSKQKQDIPEVQADREGDTGGDIIPHRRMYIE